MSKTIYKWQNKFGNVYVELFNNGTCELNVGEEKEQLDKMALSNLINTLSTARALMTDNKVLYNDLYYTVDELKQIRDEIDEIISGEI